MIILNTVFLVLYFFFLVYSVFTLLQHYITTPQDNKLKSVFQKLDHISIFYLILGSYAPVCLITLLDFSGINIFLIVFILTIIGTILKVFFTGKIEKASLLLYLVMGWLIISDIGTLFSLIPASSKNSSCHFRFVLYNWDFILQIQQTICSHNLASYLYLSGST